MRTASALKIMVGSQTKYAFVVQEHPKTSSKSYLQEWLWRKHYGDDPFGNIIKHIADFYEVRKDA